MSESNTLEKRSGKPESAFTPKYKVLTDDHSGSEDAKDIDWGALNPQTIKMPTAVAESLPGTDVKVVKGDYIEWIKNNKNTKVLQNEDLAVQGNQKETVSQRTDLVYVHERHITIGDLDQKQVNGIQKTVVTGESEETYLDTHEIHAPEEFEFKKWERGWTNVETKGTGWVTEFVAVEASLKVKEFPVRERIVKAWETYDAAGEHEGLALGLSDHAKISANAEPVANIGPETGPGHLPPIPV